MVKAAAAIIGACMRRADGSGLGCHQLEEKMTDAAATIAGAGMRSADGSGSAWSAAVIRGLLEAGAGTRPTPDAMLDSLTVGPS